MLGKGVKLTAYVSCIILDLLQFPDGEFVAALSELLFLQNAYTVLCDIITGTLTHG
jgi:hypothetical protein